MANKAKAKKANPKKKAKHPTFSVPWRRAPFFCFPQMATTPEAWSSNMSEIILELAPSILEPEYVINKKSDYELDIEYNSLALNIDARRGDISLLTMPIGKCECIVSSGWIVKDKTPFRRDLYTDAELCHEVMFGFASSLFYRMYSLFQSAVRQGIVSVKARANSPLADLQMIEPGQLRYFEDYDEISSEINGLHPNDPAELFCGNGDKLYSALVEPGCAATVGRTAGMPLPSTTQGKETRAVRFLTEKLKANSEIIAEEAKKLLVENGLTLGPRPFMRALAAAREASNTQSPIGRPPLKKNLTRSDDGSI